MCGITGWVNHERDLSTDPSIIAAMTATLTPRGPDDVGTYVSRAVALGHRRLAVLDPAHGAQPMVRATATGEVVLVFSGEVYNFTELRRRLIGRGHRFVTGTDTEVVLAAYLEWGLRAPERLEGMFAFAVWDGRTRRLHLVRDRLGVKPLLLLRTPAGVVFASEAKAVLANPLARAVVDRDGVRRMLAHVLALPGTPWARIEEVEPGTVVTVSPEGLTRPGVLEARADRRGPRRPGGGRGRRAGAGAGGSAASAGGRRPGGRAALRRPGLQHPGRAGRAASADLLRRSWRRGGAVHRRLRAGRRRPAVRAADGRGDRLPPPHGGPGRPGGQRPVGSAGGGGCLRPAARLRRPGSVDAAVLHPGEGTRDGGALRRGRGRGVRRVLLVPPAFRRPGSRPLRLGERLPGHLRRAAAGPAAGAGRRPRPGHLPARSLCRCGSGGSRGYRRGDAGGAADPDQPVSPPQPPPAGATGTQGPAEHGDRAGGARSLHRSPFGGVRSVRPLGSPLCRRPGEEPAAGCLRRPSARGDHRSCEERLPGAARAGGFRRRPGRGGGVAGRTRTRRLRSRRRTLAASAGPPCPDRGSPR